jgi:hypothetical protein
MGNDAILPYRSLRLFQGKFRQFATDQDIAIRPNPKDDQAFWSGVASRKVADFAGNFGKSASVRK